MKNILLQILLLLIIANCFYSQELGKYLSKKEYVEKKIPKFVNNKHLLPNPILENNLEYIELYWKCWEIAFRGIKQPAKDSPLVSNWLDEAFSENIFQWDTIFMLMFARYGHHIFPAIESLDNFYALQYESGFIGREFRESDGKLIHFDFDGGLFSPKGWKNMINPPLFAWVEVESYKVTGDKSRFNLVLPVLEKYAEWLNRDGNPDDLDWENNGRISKNSVHKLYWNTPLGSGMDNTPRPIENGVGWVEMSAQIVIMYNNLAIICDELNLHKKAELYRKEAEEIGKRIIKWCWNEEDGFYYDVNSKGEQFKKKTSGGFWPLLAGIASKKQAKRMVGHLTNKNEFWRKNVFPTLSAEEEEYHEFGEYWRGGVWAPTNVMILKGLEIYGYEKLATEATCKYLDNIYQVYKDSATIFENYAPDHFAPSFPSRKNFVGWSGCGPIQLLIENILGIRVNGAENKIEWKISRLDRHGIENLYFSNITVDLICGSRSSLSDVIHTKITASKDFVLIIEKNGQSKSFSISKGESEISF